MFSVLSPPPAGSFSTPFCLSLSCHSACVFSLHTSGCGSSTRIRNVLVGLPDLSFTNLRGAVISVDRWKVMFFIQGRTAFPKCRFSHTASLAALRLFLPLVFVCVQPIGPLMLLIPWDIVEFCYNQVVERHFCF